MSTDGSSAAYFDTGANAAHVQPQRCAVSGNVWVEVQFSQSAPFREGGAAGEGLRERVVMFGDGSTIVVGVAPRRPECGRIAQCPSMFHEAVQQQVQTAGGVQFSVRRSDFPGHGVVPSVRAVASFAQLDFYRSVTDDPMLGG